MSNSLAVRTYNDEGMLLEGIVEVFRSKCQNFLIRSNGDREQSYGSENRRESDESKLGHPCQLVSLDWKMKWSELTMQSDQNLNLFLWWKKLFLHGQI
jgi:hypothetical protein